MKRALFLSLSLLSSMIAPLTAFAALPAHMETACMFTFKSSVPPAESKKAALAYLQAIKDKGYGCVIVKSHDGDNWGTKVGKEWKPAISKELVAAGHELNMRIYGYFTARLNHDSVIDESVNLAERVLKMGADGIVIDDLALAGTGTNPEKWRRIFPQLRALVDRYPGTILASSTHPHLHVDGTFPVLWGIAFSYSDYFLPQEYWMEFVAYKDGKRIKMTPEDALAYGQAQFNVVQTRYPNAKGCKLVPVGRTYGKNVTTQQVKAFLDAARPWYKGVGLFVIEQEPPEGGWNAIKEAAEAFKPGRTIADISIIERIKNPPKEKHHNQASETKSDDGPQSEKPKRHWHKEH